MDPWRPEASAQVTRVRPLLSLTRPLRERAFTFEAYAEFLEALAGSRVAVVPLREFAAARGDGPILGLRHDVDLRIDSALRLAELEHERGLRATYFVLNTAPYWRKPGLLDALLRLQELGHEVGWHNDLVSMELVDGTDTVDYLRRELARLRGAGVDIVGTAAHGSIWCHVLGFDNNAFFTDFPEVKQPATTIRTGALADFGFDYEAYHLGEDRYYSDSRFDVHGRRWHPSFLDLDEVEPAAGAIALVHPCHWDASVAAKFGRLPARFAAKPGEVWLRRRVRRRQH
jgi:hypothetical protein